VGRDCWETALAYLNLMVSIHAPTWGATRVSLLSFARLMFQSTRPRGARPLRVHRAASVECFNPRAHVGRDGLVRFPCQGGPVSIHAPTWGATRKMWKWRCGERVFQSTRPRGARQRAFHKGTRVHKFQSTRPRGARL